MIRAESENFVLYDFKSFLNNVLPFFDIQYSKYIPDTISQFKLVLIDLRLPPPEP